MKLIVVESPAKARTIEKFLGPGYKVAASYGHIRDLPSSASEIPAKFRKEPWARLGVDTENQFRPIYVVSKDSQKHVAALKKLIAKADELLLATDEDREGEAISWHLLEVLKPKIPVRRITFHEITKSAIADALANPREVNNQLVRAQESRRILDRLYGYSLSPVLWKKVRTKLSAGRVQSVAVRLIVEREEARQAFQMATYWDVEATLCSGDLEFKARLFSRNGLKLATGKDFDPNTGQLKDPVKVLSLDETTAQRIAEAAKTSRWLVKLVERQQTKQRPAPPFITSTLQQAASARLGMSPRKTMLVAQHLYEGIDLGGGAREGLITYMRTDSLTLSEKALAETAQLITDQFGPDYTTGPRRYKTKAKSAQEAHEAIRPTDVNRTPESVMHHLNKEELSLYRLVWQRAVASQMADALLDKTTVEFLVEVDGVAHIFRANGSVVRFPGYLRVYGDTQKDTLLPDLKEGQVCPPAAAESPAPSPATTWVRGTESRRHETIPPARYTEATLIKKLEEEGIGRPSTYAPVISTIQARNYVLKKGGALLPSYIGMAVVHILRSHFRKYVDLKFTAKMEEDLDAIAAGDIDHITFLSSFYQGNGDTGQGLLERIEQQLPAIEFPAIPIGQDPETQEAITVRIGRNYVYVQVGEGGTSRTATLPVDLLIDELTPAKAVELVSARAKSLEPLGQDPQSGKNVYALVGPYGPYVQLGEPEGKKKPKRISLPKGTDPRNVSLEEALRFLALPRNLGTDPETDKPVTAGLGRFGPFVERDRVFARLDSLDRVFTIGLDEALELIRNKNRKTVIKDLGAHPETGQPLQVLKGRYGPYLTDGQVNVKLAHLEDPAEVSLQEAFELLQASHAKNQATGQGTVRRQKVQRSPKMKKRIAGTMTRKTARKSPEKSAPKSLKASGEKPGSTSEKTGARQTKARTRKKTGKKIGKKTGKKISKKTSKKTGE